jgi:hypothetical protein
MIPNNELSNIDIINIINDMNLNKYFGGVYSKDELPINLKYKHYYIINLDDKKNGGTHWTVFFYNFPLTSLYFDSFGFVAPEQVENEIEPYLYNDNDVQDYESSSACGYFCIAFIKFLYNQDDKIKAFNTFINLFKSETNKNDLILYQILYPYNLKK